MMVQRGGKVSSVVASILARSATSIALAVVGLACLQGCGSSSTDPCDSVACANGLQCVNGKCVQGNNDSDGGVAGSSGNNNDGATVFETGTNDGDFEAYVCYAKDIPWENTQIAYQVPTGAYWMHVKAWGGGANQEGECPGGSGGYAEALFPVTAGTELVLVVGAPGTASDGEEAFLTGFGHTGGSGLTGIFTGPGTVSASDSNKAWIIAGGGGGAGVKSGGGPCIPGVPGNHPTAGGMDTMRGGKGLDDNVNGGGGGYKGGKGGKVGENGLGGTSYVDSSKTSEPFYLLNSEIGEDKPPNSTDDDYQSGAGCYERGGLLVVKFTCDKPVVKPPK